MRVDVDDAVGKCCFQDVYGDYSVQQSNLLGSTIIDSKYVLRRTLHSEVRGVLYYGLPTTRNYSQYRMATGQPVLHCGGGFNCETLTLLLKRDKRQGRYRGNEHLHIGQCLLTARARVQGQGQGQTRKDSQSGMNEDIVFLWNSECEFNS